MHGLPTSSWPTHQGHPMSSVDFLHSLWPTDNNQTMTGFACTQRSVDVRYGLPTSPLAYTEWFVGVERGPTASYQYPT